MSSVVLYIALQQAKLVVGHSSCCDLEWYVMVMEEAERRDKEV